MFTGIITHLGQLKKQEETIFTFSADASLIRQLDKGTSIAVNGICLTVLRKPTGNTFSIEVMPETQKKTALHQITTDSIVNLELPATADTFLSGHIVQGHVDGVGKITSITDEGNSKEIKISIPKKLSRYLVEKGSITVNGISMTVIESAASFFTIGVIPFTWEHTMLHTVKVGDEVNIEVDVLAKYIERLLQK